MRAAGDGYGMASGARPYLGLRHTPRGPVIEGQARCLLGRRIPVDGRPRDDGEFVEWHWDGRRLTAMNSRLGMYPLFYCAKASSIWLSPCLATVVRGNSERALDLPALAVFHRLGHFVGDDTPFADVRMLPAGSTLAWEAGSLQLTTDDVGFGGVSAQASNFDEAVEAYRHLFAQSISRRLPEGEDFAVPLSGGRDSRHILLELMRQGRRPALCVTVQYRPPASNEDARVASMLAQRLGVEHRVLECPASYFKAELEDLHLTNHCGGGHGWVLPVAACLGGAVGTSYDGLAGDILSAGFLYAEERHRMYRDGAFEKLAISLLRDLGREGLLARVFAGGFYAAIPFEQAVARTAAELARHAGRPNPLMTFLLCNRTRRMVASIPFSIMHRVPVVHTPFLDSDLVDFLASLDPSFVAGGRLHDETIRRSYPDFADVPYQNKAVKVGYSAADRRHYPQARREFLRYLRGATTPDSRLVRRPYLYTKIVADLVTGRIDPPWYMRPALQAIELQRLRGDD